MSEYVEKLDYLEETKALIREAIVEKGVDVSESDSFRSYAEKIEEITTGGGEPEPTGILYRFLDYDGKLLYTFTEEEKNALTELPPMTETHEGMHFTRWSWTLDELKAVNLGANVGALWDTDDGFTHLFITVKEPVEFQMYCNVSGSNVAINWGDGSAEDSFTYKQRLYHWYEKGDYDVVIKYPEGGFSLKMFDWDKEKLYPYWNIDFKELRLGSRVSMGGDAANFSLGLKKFSRGSDSTNDNTNMFSKESIDFIASPSKAATYSTPFQYQKGPYPCYKYDNTTTSLGSYLFFRCSSLKEMRLPDSITSIGGDMFYECSSLKTVKLPKNLTKLEYDAFQHCSSLESLALPEALTKIGNYAFDYCKSLKDIRIPEGVTSIGNYAFRYCSSLKDIHIPEGVTSIGDYAFQYCTVLESVNIPKNITSLPSNFVGYCEVLREIDIPEGVTSINSGCFSYCKSLQTITIPSTVTNMNATSIFDNCSNLIEYHMKPTTPPTLNSYSFGYSSTLPAGASAKIYVPYSEDHSILTAYQTATNWSKFAAYIVEEDQ